MRRITSFSAFALFMAAASADPAVVARIAETCTLNGAFGHSFGETHVGQVTAKADAEWAPFKKLTLTATPKSYRTELISGFAEIGAISDTRNETMGDAIGFMENLDAAITASGRFKVREAGETYLRFQTAKDPDIGVTLTLIREETGIRLECEHGPLGLEGRNEAGGSQVEY